MSQLKVTLFSAPQVYIDDSIVALPRRKVMALFTYLAMNRQPQRRDKLAALFWPESNQKRARSALRRELSTIRSAIGEEWLIATREELWIDPNADVWVDVAHFRQQVAASAGVSGAESLQCLSAAADLYVDDFLLGFTISGCPEFNDWQFFETDGLRHEAAAVLEKLVVAYEAQGEYESAVDYARRWLALDAMHEPAHRKLMQLFALAGQQAAALRQYEECQRILEEDLGVPPAEETTQLYQAIRTRRYPQPGGVAPGPEQMPAPVDDPAIMASPTPTQNLPVHNLPPQATPFIGRTEEVTAICQLLTQQADCRLLTLIGPGGIGKTRLSLQAASQLLEPFPDGVCFVALASVATVDNIVFTLADALRVPLQATAEPETQLANYLQNKHMLLVVDNMEHLLAGADLLPQLLVAAPMVKFLVTSREALDLHEEWLYPVGSLAVPEAQATRAEMEANVAVQLFVQSARRADASFSTTGEMLQTVAGICRLVDGMPLAIELAAAWSGTLAPAEIATEIGHSLDILTSAKRNVPQRHRSIRAVIEQTWQRLAPGERRVLSQLSIFRGGSTRHAAEEVAGATLPLLSSLIGKSLLRRTEQGRYELHELIRQFAAEHLADPRKPHAETQLREQHALYYTTFLHAHTADLTGSRQMEALNEIAADMDNVRSAWRWAIRTLAGHNAESVTDPAAQARYLDAIARGMESLYQFYWIRSQFLEGQVAFEEAAAAVSTLAEGAAQGAAQEAAEGADGRFDPLRTRLIARQGAFYSALGLYDEAVGLLHDSLAQAQRLDLQAEIAFVSNCLGEILRNQGNADAAQQRFQESLAVSRQVGDRFGIARALQGLGWIASDELGQYAQADGYYQESLAIYRSLQCPAQIAFMLDKYGFNCWKRGAYAQAQHLFEESLSISRRINDRLSIANTLGALALSALPQGPEKQAEAKALALESIVVCQEIGYQSEMVNRLLVMSIVVNETEAYEEAVQYSQEALSVSQQLDHDSGITQALAYLGDAHRGLGEYGAAERYLLQALDRACAASKRQHVIDTLVVFAHLWLDETSHPPHLSVRGEDPARTRQKQLDALQILFLAIAHPNSWQMFRDKATHLLRRFENQVPAALVTAAREQARQRTLLEIARSTLKAQAA